jgi:hypothetical protein
VNGEAGFRLPYSGQVNCPVDTLGMDEDQAGARTIHSPPLLHPRRAVGT